MEGTTARRSFLASGAALAAFVGVGVAATPNPPNPDTALLALCAKFHRHHAEVQRLVDTADPAWESAIDDRWAASDDLEDMHPMTEEGHRAKATVALVMLEEMRNGTSDADTRFAMTALRGWLGRA